MYPTLLDLVRLMINGVMIYQCYFFGMESKRIKHVLEWLWTDSCVYIPISILYHTYPQNLQLEFIDMLAVISRFFHISNLLRKSCNSWYFYYMTPFIFFIQWIDVISQSKSLKCAIYGPIYIYSVVISPPSWAHVIYSIGILLWCLYYNYTLLHLFEVIGHYYILLFHCDLKLCWQEKKKDDKNESWIQSPFWLLVISDKTPPSSETILDGYINLKRKILMPSCR